MTGDERSEELEEIRRQKLEELKQQASTDTHGATTSEDGTGSGGARATDATDDSAGTPEEPIHVESEAHYRELIERHDVVLVDFYADWCGPCKLLEPVVAELAAETDAAVLKVDIDAHQGLAGDLNVRGVPTLVLYADGTVADRVVGAQEKAALESMIDAVV